MSNASECTRVYVHDKGAILTSSLSLASERSSKLKEKKGSLRRKVVARAISVYNSLKVTRKRPQCRRQVAWRLHIDRPSHIQSQIAVPQLSMTSANSRTFAYRYNKYSRKSRLLIFYRRLSCLLARRLMYLSEKKRKRKMLDGMTR